MLVGTTVGTLLLMSSHLMMLLRSSRNIDGMVVVSSAATQGTDITKCAPATGPFSGLSCKDAFGYCAGPGESFGDHPVMTSDFETCYVTITGLDSVPTLHYCWSHSHRAKNWSWDNKHFNLSYYRCDPFDDHTHISAPLADGSCGNPCPEVYSLWIWPPPKAF